MISITGFTHRDALRDLIRRWMLDQLEPSDTTELLQLVHFNSVYVGRYLPILAEGILRRLRGSRLSSRASFTKGDLKDQLVAHLPRASERADRLIAAYRAEPGLYYRETPYCGRLYFVEGDGRRIYAGSSRIKRIRRLAEKSARRVVDWLYGEIRRRAPLGPVDPEACFGRPVDETGEGQRAPVLMLRRSERELLRRLRAAGPDRLSDDLEVNDVAGIKVIVEPGDEGRLLGVLQELGCRLVEREIHRGDYQAVNLLVDYSPDRGRILAQALPAKVLRVFRDHGIGAETANRWFDAFIAGGEPSARVEIIYSDYEETLEGEIGRCMHEDRIIRQRRLHAYQSQLAQNVEFLLELIFTLPAAPDARLERLPVRLWDRYLPDYFDEVKRALFRLPSVELNPD
ncbi:MAG: hypothetical protein LJE60_10700 [Thiocapsa sp.]|jgi:hypothetical protein|nr:hypothetical protein [Thiocapsa sp.]MCG6897558.1 hypothetical protein [Thiocapsa sp.]